MYDKLQAHYGSRNWWPAKTQFEVILGAILTQNTAWRNVESAIANLKSARLMTPQAVAKAPLTKLEKAVYP
ncbi:MAG: endonuclease III domain-containing protein, partial [Thermoplasmata archaeon]